MLGFLVGTACLIGLVKVVRGGRYGYGHGGCGPRGWHGHHHGGHGFRGGRGFGRNFFLRGIFERLDTTPGQEKVIVAALDEVREAARGMRGEASDTRADVARAVKGEVFDAEVMGAVFARHDGALETMRKVVVGAMAKVHDALDDRQRADLADLIARGARGGFVGGPYREWV